MEFGFLFVPWFGLVVVFVCGYVALSLSVYCMTGDEKGKRKGKYR